MQQQRSKLDQKLALEENTKLYEGQLNDKAEVIEQLETTISNLKDDMKKLRQ